jgi:N-acetylmuramic acid 6-phosphate etherase
MVETNECESVGIEHHILEIPKNMIPKSNIESKLREIRYNLLTEFCNKNNIETGCIVCNSGSPVAAVSKFPVEVVVGPEFVTGSTRMKSGTAQKLVLNMISTSVMIKLGRVKGNKMVDMQLSNDKLLDRGTRMVMKNTGIVDYEVAKELLLKHGSVRKATESLGK